MQPQAARPLRLSPPRAASGPAVSEPAPGPRRENGTAFAQFVTRKRHRHVRNPSEYRCDEHHAGYNRLASRRCLCFPASSRPHRPAPRSSRGPIMRRCHPLVLALGLLLPARGGAASPESVTLERLLGAPFPTSLVAAPAGGSVA